MPRVKDYTKEELQAIRDADTPKAALAAVKKLDPSRSWHAVRQKYYTMRKGTVKKASIEDGMLIAVPSGLKLIIQQGERTITIEDGAIVQMT